MATYRLGPASAGSANGTSWNNRWGPAEFNAATLAAGDLVYAGAGVYRATLTIPSSGGGLYTAGTVSYSRGSTTVVGSGTTFTGGNVAAGFVIHSPILASGTDGVTDGTTSTFLSAGGNFLAAHTGLTIRINTKGAYVAGTRNSAGSIDLATGTGAAAIPTAGTGLTYQIGPETPYDVASVTDATHLELTEPWGGPTMTGIAYRAWNPIRLIGDAFGEHTDLIGGIVRVTGSNDDATASRANAITAVTKSFFVIQGFATDTCNTTFTGTVLLSTSCTDAIVQDCDFQALDDQRYGLYTTGTTQARITTRRCTVSTGSRGTGIYYDSSSLIDNVGSLIEDCEVYGAGAGSAGINVQRPGGVLVRNNLIRHAGTAISTGVLFTTGQCTTVRQNIINACATGIDSSVGANAVLEDYNNIYGVTTPRTTPTGPVVGGNSTALPILFETPLLAPGFGPRDGTKRLGPWSPLRRKTGIARPSHDLSGMRRPSTESKVSWGPNQYLPAERSVLNVGSSTTSRYLPDAGSDGFDVRALSQTLAVTVYREADYTGTAPQVIVHQPGQADVVYTDAGAVSTENTVTLTLTPATDPSFVYVEVRSNNTATAGSYGVYFSL